MHCSSCILGQFHSVGLSGISWNLIPNGIKSQTTSSAFKFFERTNCGVIGMIIDFLFFTDYARNIVQCSCVLYDLIHYCVTTCITKLMKNITYTEKTPCEIITETGWNSPDLRVPGGATQIWLNSPRSLVIWNSPLAV